MSTFKAHMVVRPITVSPVPKALALTVLDAELPYDVRVEWEKRAAIMDCRTAKPTATLPLGQRLMAAHDACRSMLKAHPHRRLYQFEDQLDYIATKHDLSHEMVSEIMARAKDCYSPPD